MKTPCSPRYDSAFGQMVVSLILIRGKGTAQLRSANQIPARRLGVSRAGAACGGDPHFNLHETLRRRSRAASYRQKGLIMRVSPKERKFLFPPLAMSRKVG